jgi:hypothetical protein
MTERNCRHAPCTRYKFLLYCPNDGFTFWETEEERNKAGEDLIQEYLVDGEWSEEVTDIFTGTVTHTAGEVDRKERVGELDDDGYDEAGEYWSSSEYDYKCNYELRLLPTTPQQPQP